MAEETSEASNHMRIHALSENTTLVFFDGVCGLCNRFVDWLLLRDTTARCRFAPLQGETARAVLSEAERRDLDSIIILKNRRLFRRSDAVIEILLELPAPWRWVARILKVLPKVLRDFGYRLVARWRYRIWGRLETCRLPSAEERRRFLD